MHDATDATDATDAIDNTDAIDATDALGAMQGRARDLSDEGFPRRHAPHALRLLAPALARR